MSSRPISDYALLSDCHSAALVSETGSVDWLACHASTLLSIFGRLLDPGAGHWSIHPAGEYALRHPGAADAPGSRGLGLPLQLGPRRRETLDALSAVACPIDAEQLLSWLLVTAGTSTQARHHTQAVCAVGGEHDVFERELRHLEGWRGNRPVRIGSATSVADSVATCGEVLDAVCRLVGQLPPLDAPTRELLAGLADGAAARWTEPDHGRWDDRAAPQHYLYSKLMSWVALDRAISLASRLGHSARVAVWTIANAQIRAAILDRGWSPLLGAYAQAFDSDVLDATALLLATTGFLPADDARMAAAIDRVAAGLAAPCGLIYRFEHAPNTPRLEPTFLLCSYWLVQCLALAGRPRQARAIFERATAYATDVGLLSEEADPLTRELLGNFPQGMSHVGLINAATRIRVAEDARLPL